jgi:hypothetical protein
LVGTVNAIPSAAQTNRSDSYFTERKPIAELDGGRAYFELCRAVVCVGAVEPELPFPPALLPADAVVPDAAVVGVFVPPSACCR